MGRTIVQNTDDRLQMTDYRLLPAPNYARQFGPDLSVPRHAAASGKDPEKQKAQLWGWAFAFKCG
jgi:hypothetical protein